MFNFYLQRRKRGIRRLKNHAIKERRVILIFANDAFSSLYLRSSIFSRTQFYEIWVFLNNSFCNLNLAQISWMNRQSISFSVVFIFHILIFQVQNDDLFDGRKWKTLFMVLILYVATTQKNQLKAETCKCQVQHNFPFEIHNFLKIFWTRCRWKID